MTPSRFAFFFGFVFSHTLYSEVSGSASIILPPDNTTGLQGANATFYCGVSGQQNLQEALTWNKAPSTEDLAINPFQAPDILTLNQLSANPDKYLIYEKYRLKIVGVSVADEGNYECAMGNEIYFAKLTVAVPPSELTLTYPDNKTAVEISQTVNLTCTSLQARPPAKLRWFKGSKEITDQAILVMDRPDENGYGNSYSYLPLTVTADDEGAPFKCVAQLSDLPEVQGTSIRIAFSSSASVKHMHVMFAFVMLLIAIIQ